MVRRYIYATKCPEHPHSLIRLSKKTPRDPLVTALLHGILPLHGLILRNVYVYNNSTSTIIIITVGTITASISLSGIYQLFDVSSVFSVGHFCATLCPHSWLDSESSIWFDSDFLVWSDSYSPIQFKSRSTEINVYSSHSQFPPHGLPHRPECSEIIQQWNCSISQDYKNSS